MRKSHLILSLLTQCADWTLGQKVDKVAGVEDYSDEDASGFTKFMVVDFAMKSSPCLAPQNIMLDV